MGLPAPALGLNIDRCIRKEAHLMCHRALFNLYVSNLEKHLQCPCYQYADDTTFFHHSKPNELNQCTTELNNTITRLDDYSSNSNLALNNSKTKWMLISTKQMSCVHNLDEYSGEIICNAKAPE